MLIVCIAKETGKEPFWREFLTGSWGIVKEMRARTALAYAGQEEDFAELGLPAEEIYVARPHAYFSEDPEPVLAWLQNVIREAEPSLVFFPHSITNAQIAARLAFRLGAGLVTDCVSIEVSNGETINFVRQVYGGKVMAYFTGTFPIVATFRGSRRPFEGIMEKNPHALKKEIIVPETKEKVRLVEKKYLCEEGEVNLLEAKIVVGIGRGVGGPDGVQFVKEQAKRIGAATGVSKAVVDAGWALPPSLIGLSGKKVNPKLYIAVGISGSIQHMTGVSGARTVVAINVDPEAPIMENCDVGLVADYRKVLPDFISKLAKLECAS